MPEAISLSLSDQNTSISGKKHSAQKAISAKQCVKHKNLV
jgi:hypothetical protein